MNFLYQLGSVVSLFVFILVQSLLFVYAINVLQSPKRPTWKAPLTVFACFLVTVGLYYYSNADDMPYIRALLCVYGIECIILIILFLRKTRSL